MRFHLKARMARLDRSLPRAAHADVESLRTAALRLAVVLEHWISKKPSYSPPPRELISEAALSLLRTWNGEGDPPVVFDPSGSAGWFSRLEKHLRLEGWRPYLEDTEAQGAAWLAWMTKPFASATEAAASVPPQSIRSKVLDEVASCLARIEGKGALPPSWIPAALVTCVRECSASREESSRMNSEQLRRRLDELLAKCATTSVNNNKNERNTP